jgi:hypothetical protein
VECALRLRETGVDWKAWERGLRLRRVGVELNCRCELRWKGWTRCVAGAAAATRVHVRAVRSPARRYSSSIMDRGRTWCAADDPEFSRLKAAAGSLWLTENSASRRNYACARTNHRIRPACKLRVLCNTSHRIADCNHKRTNRLLGLPTVTYLA